MTVKEQDWSLSERGVKDVTRHRKKVRQAIRENLPNIIGEEAIITKKEGKVVKVPIKGLKSYHFIYSQKGDLVGIGQGEGKKGEVIGRWPKEGQPGQAGDEPGIDYLETEINIEELIEMMFEDLGLPNLQQKEVAETIIPKGWTFDSIEKHGLRVRLDKRRTLKEAIKRRASFIKELMERTGASEEECQEALYQAKDDLLKAEEILKKSKVEPSDVKRPPFLFTEDLRFRTLKEDIEYHSNAVVLAMMDVSGSMGMMKKYLARSFFFWLVEFLRHLYKRVEIRFIVHTTEAKIVDEHEFFHKGESGGTFCWSAYEMALHLVETEYNPEKWNIYAFHFSDGEDWDTEKTVEAGLKLMLKNINMLGYGEIQVNRDYSISHLMETFEQSLGLSLVDPSARDKEKIKIWLNKGLPFVGVIVEDKSHIWPALKAFLKKEREEAE